MSKEVGPDVLPLGEYSSRMPRISLKKIATVTHSSDCAMRYLYFHRLRDRTKPYRWKQWAFYQEDLKVTDKADTDTSSDVGGM